MKSAIKDETNNLDYPKLMKSKTDKRVVLFTERGEGVVVHEASGFYKLGSFVSGWDMDCFVNYQGTVELSNQ